MTGLRMLLAIAATLILAAPAAAQETDRLIGIWATQVRSSPVLRGPLTIERGKHGWTATIARRRTSFAPYGDSLRANFGTEGGFRGRLAKGAIRGFWVQPESRLGKSQDPGGASQSFATPLVLKRVAPNAWRGTVAPLDNRFTLWLSIFRAADGSLMAAFRNPEFNSNGGASRFDVTHSGGAIRFSVKANGREIVHEATFLGNPERIRLDWSDLGQPLELTRRSAGEATAFFPRPPGSPPYAYRAPASLADGWRTGRASETGIDEAALEEIVRSIASADPTARPPQLIHAVLVAHRGRLVLEEYFYGFHRSVPHDIRSAGKTFASVLLGTAPARTAALSPDTRIYRVMAPIGPFANPDSRKGKITLTHLMTHTSGLACNDNDDNSPGNEGTMQAQKAEPNWWRYTLNLPQVFEPGARYAYCSANTNLAGGALTVATRTWLPELFQKTIADPLQFGEWHWNMMANGEGYLGGGAFLLPRDFLKVGEMYLDGGIWNGRRIVPADWVRRSTTAAVEVSPQTTGLSDEEFGNFYGRGEDGLAWHLGTIKANTRSYDTYAATGNGGQVLLVVPGADLAVVFTGGNYGQGGVWGRWAQQIVGDKIIPAIHPR